MELYKHSKLFFTFLKQAILSELEYKINFFSGLLVESCYFFTKIAYIFVVAASETSELTVSETAIYIGTFTIITGFFMMYWPSLSNFTNYIKNGGLDLLLTKPIDIQFIITLRHLSFSMIIPEIVGGIILVIWGMYSGNYMWEWGAIVGYLIFIILGAILLYSIILIPKALFSFWFINSSGVDIFISAIWDANNMPMQIYPKVIQFIFSVIIPIFLVANYPTRFLLGTISVKDIIVKFLITCIVFIIARKVFLRGVLRYHSANG